MLAVASLITIAGLLLLPSPAFSQVNNKPLQAAVPAAELPQTRQAVEEYSQLSRRLIAVELGSILAACQPSREQEVTLRDAAERFLEAKVAEFRTLQAGRGARPTSLSSVYPPYRWIRNELPQRLKPHVSPKQWARYEAEIERRAAFRKRTAVVSVVERLDRALDLSTSQRARITESLSAHWDPNWNPSPDALFDAEATPPRIPEEFLVPFLDPGQFRLWSVLPKGHHEGVKDVESTMQALVGGFVPQWDHAGAYYELLGKITLDQLNHR